MPNSTPKPGTGISGLYFADGRGTVLDFTGIVVATTSDRFTVEFHGGHRATYNLSTETDYWERTERALTYVGCWVATFEDAQPKDSAEFLRTMNMNGYWPKPSDLHKALAILSLPRDRVERLMAPFADA